MNNLDGKKVYRENILYSLEFRILKLKKEKNIYPFIGYNGWK